MRKSRLTISGLSPQDLALVYPDHWRGFESAWGAFEDETCVAIAGYVPWEGRLWVCFEVFKRGTACGAAMVRALQKGLEYHNRTCVVQCDDKPTAPRLLRLLGFTPTEDFRVSAKNELTPLRIWQWQTQRPCF